MTSLFCVAKNMHKIINTILTHCKMMTEHFEKVRELLESFTRKSKVQTGATLFVPLYKSMKFIV